MTGLSSLFFSYSISSSKDKVRVANEILSSIFGKWNINVSPLLSLSSVLHVPKLATNLLSINRITHDFNCLVIFFPSHCVFQDLALKQTIMSGRVVDELYLLDADANPSSFTALHSSNSSKDNKDRLMQWHNCMDHMSFFSMTLFPSLFSSSLLLDINCEVCQLSKHVQNSYPLSNNKSSLPFSIVDSDVWRSSPTTSLFGFRYFVTFC